MKVLILFGSAETLYNVIPHKGIAYSNLCQFTQTVYIFITVLIFECAWTNTGLLSGLPDCFALIMFSGLQLAP